MKMFGNEIKLYQIRNINNIFKKFKTFNFSAIKVLIRSIKLYKTNKYKKCEIKLYLTLLGSFAPLLI